MCYAKELETYLNDEQIAQIQELADKQGNHIAYLQ